MTNIDLRNEYSNAKNRAFDQGCEGGFRADYTEWLEQKLASNTEIIGNVSNSVIQEIERRRDLIISEPDGIVRETMISNLAIDL